MRVPVTSVESVAKSLDCASLISAEGRDMGGGGLEDSVAAAGCVGVRSLLCMCLLTKTHSSLMLTPAALPKPGGSLSHRAGQ